jgi:hypothetical protein
MPRAARMVPKRSVRERIRKIGDGFKQGVKISRRGSTKEYRVEGVIKPLGRPKKDEK